MAKLITVGNVEDHKVRRFSFIGAGPGSMAWPFPLLVPKLLWPSLQRSS